MYKYIDLVRSNSKDIFKIQRDRFYSKEDEQQVECEDFFRIFFRFYLDKIYFKFFVIFLLVIFFYGFQRWKTFT